ncbi:MAG: hypothetical protein NVV62_07965 [Terricaulis sp.]|nr:hypothetical protein [Terricaulis sp.]
MSARLHLLFMYPEEDFLGPASEEAYWRLAGEVSAAAAGIYTELALHAEALSGKLQRAVAAQTTPVRIAPLRPRANDAFTIAVLGAGRWDKAFDRLPAIVAATHARDPSVRFVIQAPAAAAGLGAPRDALGAMAGVALLPPSLDDAAYEEALRDCAAVLLAYDKQRYRTRGSGVLVDALIGGRPIIATADTALAREMAQGAGLTGEDPESFAAAITAMRADYPRFSRRRRKRSGAPAGNAAQRAVIAGARGRRMRIAFHPAFTNADTFADRYWRAAHYLGPVAAHISSITMLSDLDAPDAPPDYLDPALRARAAPFREKLRVQPANTAPPPCDLLIVWDQACARDAPHAAEVSVLDPAMLHEGDLWIELGARIAPASAVARAETHGKLKAAIAAARADVVNLFGSGPSLGALDLDALTPGANVVCNSLVVNSALIERLKPAFIVAVDPIFHAGASRHAGAFREKLAEAMRASGAFFVAQERDAHIYAAALAEDVRARVISVPVRFGLAPNLDLDRRFHFTATRNVLTLAMLPLAAQLGCEVRCYGFDGRPATQRDIFWDYAPSAVMAPELAQQRQAHPGFFTLDYQDYYALHCGTVAAWIARMEQRGTIVRAGAPSHIPALAARGLPGVAPASTPSPAFAREIARAYRRRRLQAIYGAVLEAAWAPEWGKRALRGAVALARTG